MKMNQKNSFILLLALTSFLVGCGSQPGESKLKVSIAAVTGSANFPGGLVVFGSSTNGDRFSKVINSSDSDEISIPNGTWNFAAIGWTEAAGLLEASSINKVKCDVIQSANLNGGDFDLVMNTSNAKCANAIFGNELNVDTNFKQLRFNSCLGVKRYIEELGTIPEGIACEPSDDIITGNADSVRISILELGLDGSVTPGLISTCFNTFSHGAQDSMVSLPFGSSNFAIGYQIETFTDTSCSVGKNTYIFQESFTKSLADSSASATPNQTDDKLDIYLNQEACDASQLVGAMGAGTTGGPYMVCTKTHFENIADITTYEVDAVYIIGKDIDFGGSNTTILTPFRGEIDGGKFTLKNGDSPLFDSINNNSTDEVRIHDINIENFDLSMTTTAVNDSFGILANFVLELGTGPRIEIQDITIDAASSVVVTGTDSTISVGGLIGYVNFSSALVDENVYIRKITSFASVTSTVTSDTSNSTGGLIGKMAGSGASNNAIELCSVGFDTKDPGSFGSDRVSISGLNNVGGIVGSLVDNAEIREKVYAVTSISNSPSNVGGIVGYVSESNISDAKSDLDFNPKPVAATYNVGGAVGKVDDTTSVKIDGVNTSIIITDANTASGTFVNSLGGIVGEVNSSGVSNLEIMNSKAYINTYVSGTKHGGIIGNHVPTSAGGVSLNISSSTVSGVIALDSSIAANTSDNYRGGIAGETQHLYAKRVIVDNMSIVGFEYLGGAYGYADGSGHKLEESYISADVTSERTVSPYRAGGIVGASGANIPTGAFHTIYAMVSLDFPQNTVVDCSTDVCGLIVGDQQANTLPLYFNAIMMDLPGTPITDGDATDPTVVYCYGGSCSQTVSTGEINNLFTDPTNSGDCTTLGGVGPFVFDSTCQLAFENAWFSLGHNGSNYLAGNLLDPFPISSEADWNSIGNDSLLVSKSYELKNNITFTSAVTPIGTNDTSITDAFFSGDIIPNGFKLFNIQENSGVVEASGVFAIIGRGAQIGQRGAPLIIEGFNLDCGTEKCGFIGQVYDDRAHIYVQIKNGDINSNGFANVGGLVGYVDNGSTAYIEHSGFEGKILGAATSGSQGGLLGAISGGGSTIKIESSYANFSKIEGTGGNIGGLIGFVPGAIGNVEIEDSYVLIDPTELNAADDLPNSSTSGGLVGGQSFTGATIKNSFVDGLVADLDAFVVPISSLGGTITSGSTFYLGSATGGIVATPHAGGLTYSTLATDPNFKYDNGPGGSGFTKDASGKTVLSWQVYGFEYY